MLNENQPYAEQVKPFNFLLVAHVAPFGHPAGADPERFVLVAPYNPDARQWKKLRWTNPYQPGSSYRITTTGQPTARVARVKTYRDILTEYSTHPEPKSLGPDGQPCDRDAIGLLQRRPVRATTITHIGKEANRLEDREAGLVHDPAEVSNEYGNPGGDPFDLLVRPILHEVPILAVADATGLSERTIKRARADGSPSNNTRAALTHFAAEHARTQLRATGHDTPGHMLSAIAAYLDQTDVTGRTCANCGAKLTERHTRWCSEACRAEHRRTGLLYP